MISLTNNNRFEPENGLNRLMPENIGFGDSNDYYGIGGFNQAEPQGFSVGDLLDGAVGGTAGAGITALTSIFKNLFGNIFQEGWSLSCIGKQAFDKNNFKQYMDEAKAIVDSTNLQNADSIGNLLNQMSWRHYYSEQSIPRYKSSCSKNLRQKFSDYCKGIINGILPNIEYTTKNETSPHDSAGSYVWPIFTVKSIKSLVVIPNNPTNPSNPITPNNPSGPIIPPSDNGGVIPPIGYNPDNYFDENQGLQNAFAQMQTTDQMLLASYATSNNIGLLEVLKGYFSGSIVIRDGKVTWNASGGNQPKTSLIDYLLFGAVGFGLYKFIKK